MNIFQCLDLAKNTFGWARQPLSHPLLVCSRSLPNAMRRPMLPARAATALLAVLETPGRCRQVMDVMFTNLVTWPTAESRPADRL